MHRTSAILFAVTLAFAVALPYGCDRSKPPAPIVAAAPSTPAKLRLLVVGDTALAQRITRLRGEWSARAGASLAVTEMTAAELAKVKSLDADVLIYPSDELGTLAERRLIRPLSSNRLDRADYHKADLFELPGLRETTWGEQTYAVPLGSPVFVCFYRTDLFEQAGRQPPRTWAEYQQLVEFFAGRDRSKPNSGSTPLVATLEPLAPGWAGKVLLARAAAYAKHRDYYSALFDKDSFEPQIGTEPFVRALTELIATAKLGPKSQMDDTPAEVRREFFAGHSALALSWPTAADRLAPSPDADEGSTKSASAPSAPALSATALSASPAIAIGFVELPGSSEVFHPHDHQWLARKPDDDPHVPLLGIAGRLGSITRETPAADGAFDLLVWLSGNEWSAQVSTASSATTFFRRSQVAQAQRWVEPDLSPSATKQYAEVASQSFSRSGWLFSPRLPGHEEYMAALDDAVRRAIAGSASPAAALSEAAARWQKITERLGRPEQQRAYCHSLSLEE